MTESLTRGGAGVKVRWRRCQQQRLGGICGVFMGYWTIYGLLTQPIYMVVWSLTNAALPSQSIKDLPILQDAPPPGGFPSIRIERRLPNTGPTGVAIFAVMGAVVGYGFYRVSNCLHIPACDPSLTVQSTSANARACALRVCVPRS